jgi:hypothetical protein
MQWPVLVVQIIAQKADVASGFSPNDEFLR